MHRFVKQGVLPLVGLLLSAVSVHAQTIASSARQKDAGSLEASVYYQGTRDQELNFAVGGSGGCADRTNTVTYSCESTADIPAEGSGDAMIAKLVYQPYESVQYYVSAGVGNYALKTASITVTNTHGGDRPGFLYAAGLKAVIWPESIVTPAIALDAQLGWQRYYFNDMQPGVGENNAVSTAVDERFDIFHTQVALETSRRFKFKGERLQVEPYGGIKWLRAQAWIKDLRRGGRAGGAQDTATPFLGVRLPIFEKEVFFAEASFINGIQFAAGLNVQFGGKKA
ncbi:MAG: hypothetical protein A2X36_08805 [Elusimicrobia bacterium GWA2_69_24]|nr:MAG: hypothetical protein A2X36_08805 [Elusimicrobia bacterium GWA2_69_24]HBL18583.1 hypothetical protein [Elusimicrobiota bacterium]